MQLAYNQARKALGNTGENPAVGCVVVKNNILLSLAHTGKNGIPHAEKATLSLKKTNFNNSTLYSTLEPCSHHGKTPPCTDLILKKKIKRLYFSKLDPDSRSYNKAKKILEKKGINVNFNILKSYGSNFYKYFYIRKKTNNIFISSKLATSKDLFTSNKSKKWLTNNYSRKRVHLLRANHDSILTTSTTILKDNSILDCRIEGLEKYSPIKFVLDKNLLVPLSANLFKSSNKVKTFVFYNKYNKKKLIKLKKLGVKAIKIPIKYNHLDFEEIITFVKKQGLSRLFIEAGIKFNKFLIENKYINVFYHFFSNDLIRNLGFNNGKILLKKINKTKIKKTKIKVNLLNDHLIEYKIK